MYFTAVNISVPTMMSAGEEDGIVEVCATLSATEITERNFTVVLFTSDGTGIIRSCIYRNSKYAISAEEITDYSSVLSFIVFTLGSTDLTTKCVDIALVNDDALEGNQTFTVMLSTSDPDVIIRRNTTIITITDNDS